MPSALIEHLRRQSGQHGKKGRKIPTARMKIASEATPAANTASLPQTCGLEAHRVANPISQAPCVLSVHDMSNTTTPPLPPVGSYKGNDDFRFELSVERGKCGQMLIVLDFYINQHIVNEDTSDPSEHTPSISIAWLSAVTCHDQPAIHHCDFKFTQLASTCAHGSDACNPKQQRYTNIGFDSNVPMITDFDDEIWQGVDDDNVKQTLRLLCFGEGPLRIGFCIIEEYESVPLEDECVYVLRAATKESPRHHYEARESDQSVCTIHKRELNEELQQEFREPPSSPHGPVASTDLLLTHGCESGSPCIIRVNAQGPLTGYLNLNNANSDDEDDDDALLQPTISFSQKPNASPTLTISLSRPNGPPIAQTSWAADDRQHGAWSVQDASVVRTAQHMSDGSMHVLASCSGEEERRTIVTLSFRALPQQHLARCSETPLAGASDGTRRAMGVMFLGFEQYHLRVWFRCPAGKSDGGLAVFMRALERREAPRQCLGDGEADTVVDPVEERHGRLQQRAEDGRAGTGFPSERLRGSSRRLESDWVEVNCPDVAGSGREKPSDLDQKTLSIRADDSDRCGEPTVDETRDRKDTTETVIRAEASSEKEEDETRVVEGDFKVHASSKSLDRKRRWATMLLVLLIWNLSPRTRLFN